MHRAGIHASGVYTLHIANLSEPKKVSTAQRGLPLQHLGVLLTPGPPSATQCTLPPYHSGYPCGMGTSQPLLPGQCPPPRLAVGLRCLRGCRGGEGEGRGGIKLILKAPPQPTHKHHASAPAHGHRGGRDPPSQALGTAHARQPLGKL